MDLRQEVELTLLPGGDDTTTVLEWQLRGTRFKEFEIASTAQPTRAWVEAHYEDVRWRTALWGTGMIGALADDDGAYRDE